MNNGIVVVTAVGVGGVMSGQTLASGDTQSHSLKSSLEVVRSQRVCLAALIFNFSACLRRRHHTCFAVGLF